MVLSFTYVEDALEKKFLGAKLVTLAPKPLGVLGTTLGKKKVANVNLKEI
jgi:hypothetical protein